MCMHSKRAKTNQGDIKRETMTWEITMSYTKQALLNTPDERAQSISANGKCLHATNKKSLLQIMWNAKNRTHTIGIHLLSFFSFIGCFFLSCSLQMDINVSIEIVSSNNNNRRMQHHQTNTQKKTRTNRIIWTGEQVNGCLCVIAIAIASEWYNVRLTQILILFVSIENVPIVDWKFEKKWNRMNVLYFTCIQWCTRCDMPFENRSKIWNALFIASLQRYCPNIEREWFFPWINAVQNWT